MLQAMGYAGARLIETRLTYFQDDLQKFDWPIRSSVRLATKSDIPALRKVAIDARNPFDRYHADPFSHGRFPTDIWPHSQRIQSMDLPIS